MEKKLCRNCGGRSQILGDDGELELDELDKEGLCELCSRKKFYLAAERKQRDLERK